MDNENIGNDAASTTRSFTLLFILGWGLVLLAAFARSVYMCIRKLFRGNETQRVSNDGTRNMRTSGGRILVLELYRTMSSERKEEIENLRKNALLRYLSGFTLVRIIIDERHIFYICWKQDFYSRLRPFRDHVVQRN